MPKFEFQILCENCEIDSGSCDVPIDSLIDLGFDAKKIHKKSSSTHCVSATIKLDKDVSEETIMTKILESEHVKQIIINPKLF